MNKIISFSIEEELFQKIEKLRGLVSRSAYLEFILKKYLERENVKQSY